MQIRYCLSVILVGVLFAASIGGAQQMRRMMRPKIVLDRNSKAAVIESVAVRIDKQYLFPDLAATMSKALRSKSKNGAFDQTSDATEFAQAITQVLQDISHDKHTHVEFAPRMAVDLIASERMPDGERKPSPDMLLDLKRRNYGFGRIEIVSGNVGYLNLMQFPNMQYASETAIAAMNFLSNADAIIIDLRENGGGDGAMVAFLCSYFFEGEPRLVNNSTFRDSGQNIQSWTSSYVPGKRMPDVPLFILTSAHTFSAAEEFAYDLQSMKRATLIGETTGGGAHHNNFVSVDTNFVMSISIGQAINPTTHTNWEGTGVQPDIAAPQEKALALAHAEALKKLADKSTDEQRRRTLEWLMESLRAEASPVTLEERQLKKYVGTYGDRTITFERGSLYYQRKGRAKFPMIPMADNLFMFKELESFRLRFDQNPDGTVKLSGLYDNGMVD